MDCFEFSSLRASLAEQSAEMRIRRALIRSIMPILSSPVRGFTIVLIRHD